MSSKFYFLEDKYSKLYLISQSAEVLSHIDTSACMSKCRIFVEEIVNLVRVLEKMDSPANMTLKEKIRDLKNKNIIPPGTNKILNSIRCKGNKGAHNHLDSLDKIASREVLKECYQISLWFIYTYESEYIEDKKYENLAEVNISVGELEHVIEKAPSYTGSMELKIIELNQNKKEVKKRRKRSFKIDTGTAIGGVLGIGLTTVGSIALRMTPVGIATGLLSGLGYLTYKIIKENEDD